jgi:hypothetical protein
MLLTEAADPECSERSSEPPSHNPAKQRSPRGRRLRNRHGQLIESIGVQRVPPLFRRRSRTPSRGDAAGRLLRVYEDETSIRSVSLAMNEKEDAWVMVPRSAVSCLSGP